MSKLETERLVLRAFRGTDADEFARLSGDWAVASMTSDIPYPFSPAQAVGWLKPARGEVRFGIEREGRLIGGVGYYRRPSGIAELGFWIGRPWWGHGFATEASRIVVRYGFRQSAAAGLLFRALRGQRGFRPGACQARLRARRPRPHCLRRAPAGRGGGHLLARPAARPDGRAELEIADRSPAAGALARLARPLWYPLISVHKRGRPHARTLLTRDTFEARAR